MSSKGAKIPTPKPGPLEIAQADFLKSQKANVLDPIQSALMPAALPAASQAFNTTLTAPDRETIEGQFQQSKNDIINNAGGRGGFLRKAMTQNDISRAQAVSSAANQAKQTGISRALGLLGPAGFPGANTTISAGQGLVGSEQNRMNLGAQQQAAQGQGMGSLIGGLGSLGLAAYGMGLF